LIAFVSNRQFDPEVSVDAWRDRDQDIWMMTADGRHQVRITSNQDSDRCVTWSPDGNLLIFTATGSDSAERLRIVDVSELIAAYRSDNSDDIQRVASKLRSYSLELDRSALEAEIEARRHPFFLTSLLPDFLVRPIYGEEYFGSERYPDWIGALVREPMAMARSSQAAE
jgi:hypothetical protein